MVEASPVELPARYATRWRDPFEAAIAQRRDTATAILDIGSGRHPTLGPGERPAGVRYVGFDLSADELAAAGPGAYSEHVVADVALRQPALDGAFDLAVSWQVLEHTRDLRGAVENVRAYLRPGGSFVALFSGAWSAFGVANRLLPNRIGTPLVEAVMRRKELNRPVFPAYYDRCYASALRRVFAHWASADIRPLYRGATYFGFSRRLTRAYLAYEDLIYRRQTANLATHYLIVAER